MGSEKLLSAIKTQESVAPSLKSPIKKASSTAAYIKPPQLNRGLCWGGWQVRPTVHFDVPVGRQAYERVGLRS